MGVTHVTTRLKSLSGKGRAYQAEFLVDTGAIDCLAPASKLKAAGVKREGTAIYELLMDLRESVLSERRPLRR